MFIDGIIKGITEGIIGPITSVFNKKEDVKLETYRIDGKVNIEALKAEIEARRIDADFRVKVSAEKSVKISRGVLLGLNLVYFSLIYWDSCFRDLLPGWTWRVLALPPSIEYLPHLTTTLLLGEAVYTRYKK